MLKGKTFSRQPVFAQLIGMINRSIFASLEKEHNADHYSKRCKSWEHLMCMLYCIMKKCVGRKTADGKSKGGIKVHTMLNAYEQVPQLIHFADAVTHDYTFLSKLHL
ncbi:DUF4372 domain-containing protein [Pedobacter sp. JCM 36344]|uniref:DUF4372 domain-containing protein n=1 Tax=Pedobacter sp. JCM 36344 TaxID=3374280 RepID=UPI00397C3DEF